MNHLHMMQMIQIDEVIAQASNTNEPLVYDANDSDPEFIETQELANDLT